MKRLVNILLLLFGISFVLIVTSGVVNVDCLFKTLFGIRCPGCGLTRSFKAIFDLDFYGAFNYNILGIPLFVISVMVCICMIIDIVRNDDRTIRYIFNFFKKYYVLVIILLIVSMIINNVKGI